jgi:glyoxylase-like metal-dependent hydrolase (beta-lactamase superfamily II)
MEVFMLKYSKIEIAEGFYCIDQEYVRCFLFLGEKEGLLVDTGVGGDLRAYVEEITGLPIRVIFTHADGDHVGAAVQFENRLMHPSEFDYYRSKNAEPVPMEPVWEGDILDVGSYRFEVIHIPGHTPGSIALLEREKRFLIGGDSIQAGGNIFMFGNGRNFEAFRASMLKLEGLIGDFDKIYSSHYDLLVNPAVIKKLYTGAGRVMEKKVKAKTELLYDREVSSYETEGVAFYAD